MVTTYDWCCFELTVDVSNIPLTPIDHAIQDLKFDRGSILNMNIFGSSEGIFLYTINDKTRKNYQKEVTTIEKQCDLINHIGAAMFSENQLGILVDAQINDSHLIKALSQAAVIVDTPIKFDNDGLADLRITGPDSTCEKFFQDLKESIETQLIRNNSYDPTPDTPTDILSERQEEMLRAALRRGYYEIPRKVDHHDLGEMFDLAPQTVGEHIQRAENKLINQDGLQRGY